MVAKISWVVYLLECLDGSYYTGTTNNLDKRIKKHLNGGGSKYVYSKGFKKVLGFIEYKNRSIACSEEYKIKRLNRIEKLRYFEEN